MIDPVKTFGDTATRLSKNPLGIIALFIVLIYGFAAFVTSRLLKNRLLRPIFVMWAARTPSMDPYTALGTHNWWIFCFIFYAPDGLTLLPPEVLGCGRDCMQQR